jgi:hypothetical protein
LTVWVLFYRIFFINSKQIHVNLEMN